MSDLEALKQRVTLIERELTELKRRLPTGKDGKSWLDKIIGTFKDDPDFEEIVRLGREFRKSVK